LCVPTDVSPLSLHDALPILEDDSRRSDEDKSESFADLLKEFETAKRASPAGGPRRGTVVGVSADYVLIDYGAKSEGVIRSADLLDRKSTRLNSSHGSISYAV